MSGVRATEDEKRKQSCGGENGVASKNAKARENDVVVVEEEEVEEFFAILRRLHVAIGHFKRGRGTDGRELTEEGSRLRLMMEGTEINDGVKGGGVSKPVEAMEENLVGLDLNTEPDPDYLSL